MFFCNRLAFRCTAHRAHCSRNRCRNQKKVIEIQCAILSDIESPHDRIRVPWWGDVVEFESGSINKKSDLDVRI